MDVIDRAVAILRPKQPYVDWVNSLPLYGGNFTLHELSIECTAILIKDLGLDEAVRDIYAEAFEWELGVWTSDQHFWPSLRDFETFKDWFNVEVHTSVLDAVKDDMSRTEAKYWYS